MYSHRYKTWDEAAGLPETFVPLACLPGKLTISANFPEPIHYDAERKRLVYRGFMCSASYTFLHGLSTEPAYVAALDALFQATSYTLQKQKRPKRQPAPGCGCWALAAWAGSWWPRGNGCTEGRLASREREIPPRALASLLLCCGRVGEESHGQKVEGEVARRLFGVPERRGNVCRRLAPVTSPILLCS